MPSEQARRLLEKFTAAESDLDRSSIVIDLLKNVRKPQHRKDNVGSLRDTLLQIWRVLLKSLDRIDSKNGDKNGEMVMVVFLREQKATCCPPLTLIVSLRSVGPVL